MKIYIKYVLIIFTAINFVACKSHKAITTDGKDDKKNTSSNSSSLKKKYAEKLGVSESDIKNTNL